MVSFSAGSSVPQKVSCPAGQAELPSLLRLKSSRTSRSILDAAVERAGQQPALSDPAGE